MIEDIDVYLLTWNQGIVYFWGFNCQYLKNNWFFLSDVLDWEKFLSF